jgi:hypothetical protein
MPAPSITGTCVLRRTRAYSIGVATPRPSVPAIPAREARTWCRNCGHRPKRGGVKSAASSRPAGWVTDSRVRAHPRNLPCRRLTRGQSAVLGHQLVRAEYFSRRRLRLYA